MSFTSRPVNSGNRRSERRRQDNLLEAISGIAQATSGSVRFDGIDVHARPGTFRSALAYGRSTTSSTPTVRSNDAPLHRPPPSPVLDNRRPRWTTSP